MNYDPMWPQQTTGGGCPYCGASYMLNPGPHGHGICNLSRERIVHERYIGVSPDQVRQIIREELQRLGLHPNGEPGA